MPENVYITTNKEICTIIIFIPTLTFSPYDSSDYGFERKDFYQGCTPIRQGVDLNHQIIPDNCTEGANYSRTQG